MKKRRYKHPTICICRICGGRGYLEEFPHNDIFQQQDSTCVICSQCQGSGRVVVSSKVEISVVAYVPKKDKAIYEAK